jgi:hypothetical protein
MSVLSSFSGSSSPHQFFFPLLLFLSHSFSTTGPPCIKSHPKIAKILQWVAGLSHNIAGETSVRQRTCSFASGPTVSTKVRRTSLPKVRQFTSQGCRPHRRFTKHSPVETSCFHDRQSATWFALCDRQPFFLFIPFPSLTLAHHHFGVIFSDWCQFGLMGKDFGV